MDVWKKLDEEVFGPNDKYIWDKVEEIFRFEPGGLSKDWPSIKEPNPSVTYDLAPLYEARHKYHHFLMKDFAFMALKAFRECTEYSERIYALDWQHPSWWIYPHGEFDMRESTDRQNPTDILEWQDRISGFGDYYMFLAEDLSYGTFSHPWEQTICIFGEKLIRAFENYNPKIFTQVIRNNGIPIYSKLEANYFTYNIKLYESKVRDLSLYSQTNPYIISETYPYTMEDKEVLAQVRQFLWEHYVQQQLGMIKVIYKCKKEIEVIESTFFVECDNKGKWIIVEEKETIYLENILQANTNLLGKSISIYDKIKRAKIPDKSYKYKFIKKTETLDSQHYILVLGNKIRIECCSL